MATKQTNFVSNPSRGLIFIEGDELCYNYRTNQWSRIPAYDGYGMYSVDDPDLDVGLVVYSSGSVDLQNQALTDVAQTASFASGAKDLNPGGRTFVSGVRPLFNGGTVTVQVGYQDTLTEDPMWTSATTPNSRTGMANFRAEGRYVRARVDVSGGFTTGLGYEIEYGPAGTV